jgi:SAM-dependent methyltransferase
VTSYYSVHPMLLTQSVRRLLVQPLIRRDLQRKFQTQRFRATNERPVEYSFAFRYLNELQPQTVLDVGSGRSAFPALLRTCGFVVTATDNIRDYWPRGMFNQHWHVLDDDVMASKLPDETFDAVACVSVLEHIGDPLKAVASMRRVLKPGGALILTTPFGAKPHPNVYSIPGSYGARNPYPCRQSSTDDLTRWLALGFRVHAAEYWAMFLQSDYWSCGPMMRPPQQTATPSHLGCFVITKDTADENRQ